MNEEEKEAVEKAVYYIECETNDTRKKFKIEAYTIQQLVNLIDKQQKEIEKLKSRKYIFNAETNEIKEIPISDDYISKDKIKEKIEDLKENSNGDDFNLTNVIMILQSLLKKNY